MRIKRTLTRFFVNLIGDWNHEFHQAIEEKVFSEHRKMYPAGNNDAHKEIPKMREFYFMRMTITANLLVAVAALLTSFVALIVSIVALVK